MVSSSPKSSDETGFGEGNTSLFDEVVRSRREFKGGIRLESCCLRFVIEAVLSIDRDSVGGSSRPGNEVKRTFMVRGAMLQNMCRSDKYFRMTSQVVVVSCRVCEIHYIQDLAANGSGSLS